MLTKKKSYFVTGTDTGVGKTLVSAALVYTGIQKGYRAVGMKPVAAGVDDQLHNEDVDILQAASNVKLATTYTAPYILRTPAAPHIAASIDGVVIDIMHIQQCYNELEHAADVVVVEGVGGFCVPLTDATDTAGLAKQLDLPIILVVGVRLGCINMALLTVEAILARGLTIAGWVANLIDPEMLCIEDNIASLSARIPAPLLGSVPRLIDASPAIVARHVEFSALFAN